MAKMMTSFAFSCLCHHWGVCGYAGTPRFPAVEAHGTPGLSRKGQRTHRSTPPDPWDLAGKYGVQAPAKDFEAMLLGPNPTPVEHRILVRRDGGPIVPPPPGDSDHVMLSKDRSP